MTRYPPYPPEGCWFEVEYTLGRRGRGVERFDDEYVMGRWFLAMEDEGVFDSGAFQEDPVTLLQTDPGTGNTLHVLCVTDSERIPISYRHPRLVMGRIDGGSGRK